MIHTIEHTTKQVEANSSSYSGGSGTSDDGSAGSEDEVSYTIERDASAGAVDVATLLQQAEAAIRDDRRSLVAHDDAVSPGLFSTAASCTAATAHGALRCGEHDVTYTRKRTYCRRM